MSGTDPARGNDPVSHLLPVLCLLIVAALLSSITPTMKCLLQRSSLTFLWIASGRIVIGFAFLAAITACVDWKGLRSLSLVDGARFGVKPMWVASSALLSKAAGIGANFAPRTRDSFD